MIDGALRTMIDEVLMGTRKMSGPAVAPAPPKRHFSHLRHPGRPQAGPGIQMHHRNVFLDSGFARFASAPE
jgi:hypothetical protein